MLRLCGGKAALSVGGQTELSKRFPFPRAWDAHRNAEQCGKGWFVGRAVHDVLPAWLNLSAGWGELLTGCFSKAVSWPCCNSECEWIQVCGIGFGSWLFLCRLPLPDLLLSVEVQNSQNKNLFQRLPVIFIYLKVSVKTQRFIKGRVSRIWRALLSFLVLCPFPALVTHTGMVLLHKRGKESCQRHFASLISLSMCIKVRMKRSILERGYGINVVLI